MYNRTIQSPTAFEIKTQLKDLSNQLDEVSFEVEESDVCDEKVTFGVLETNGTMEMFVDNDGQATRAG
jgi:hypothetical protein